MAELRLGRPIFNGKSIYDYMIAHTEAPPNLAGLVNEEREVVARALAKKPEDRYLTCTEFVAALETFVPGNQVAD